MKAIDNKELIIALEGKRNQKGGTFRINKNSINHSI